MQATQPTFKTPHVSTRTIDLNRGDRVVSVALDDDLGLYLFTSNSTEAPPASTEEQPPRPRKTRLDAVSAGKPGAFSYYSESNRVQDSQVLWATAQGDVTAKNDLLLEPSIPTAQSLSVRELFTKVASLSLQLSELEVRIANAVVAPTTPPPAPVVIAPAPIAESIPFIAESVAESQRTLEGWHLVVAPGDPRSLLLRYSEHEVARFAAPVLQQAQHEETRVEPIIESATQQTVLESPIVSLPVEPASISPSTLSSPTDQGLQPARDEQQHLEAASVSTPTTPAASPPTSPSPSQRNPQSDPTSPVAVRAVKPVRKRTKRT